MGKVLILRSNPHWAPGGKGRISPNQPYPKGAAPEATTPLNE